MQQSAFITRQFEPDERENIILPDELSDPVGDLTHSPVKGIVHRYENRCLLTPTWVCPIYCRFCFRKDQLGQPSLTNAELDLALSYIKEHKELREVILSGGDPLYIAPSRLSFIMTELDAIDHLEHLRIHTRLLLTSPHLVRPELLQTKKPLFLALHTNHVDELTKEARACISDLHKAGLVLVSQTVLLRGVNDNADALCELFSTLLTLRVKPYYLHQLDKARGTSHFNVPIEEGRAIMQEVRRRCSGLAIPHYVQDTGIEKIIL